MGASLSKTTVLCLLAPAAGVRNATGNGVVTLEMEKHNGFQAMVNKHEDLLVEDNTRAGAGGCTETETEVRCDAQETRLGEFKTFYQTPNKQSWDEDWSSLPGVVFIFHGTDLHTNGSMSDPFGTIRATSPFGATKGSYLEERVQTIKTMLEAGYAVVAPQARTHSSSNGAGYTYWDVEKWNYLWLGKDWKKSRDAALMVGLFDKFHNMEVHAAGFSSGAYHVARLANDPVLSGKLNSATLLAGGCAWNPETITVNHPPTELLYSKEDDITDVGNIETYGKALDAAGIEHRDICPEVEKMYMPWHGRTAHRWIPNAHNYIKEWVTGHTGQRTLQPVPEAPEESSGGCMVM